MTRILFLVKHGKESKLGMLGMTALLLAVSRKEQLPSPPIISVAVSYVFLGLKYSEIWGMNFYFFIIKSPCSILTLYLYLPDILSGRPSQAFEYAGATVSSCHQVPWQPLPFPLLSEGHIRGDNHCCVPGLCWRVEQEPDEPVMLK